MVETHTWYRRRNYLHFDLPVALRAALKLVSNPDRVKTHSFFPFITFKVKKKKISSTGSGNRLKEKFKEREISYSSHVDSHIYSYYCGLLNVQYENILLDRKLGDSIIAFRKLGKSNIEFAKQAFDDITALSPCGVVALDISSYFDKIDHPLLKKCWTKLIGEQTLPVDHYAVYKSITRHSRISRDDAYKALNISKHNPKTSRYRICSAKQFREIIRKNGLIITNQSNHGIPQGSPISALLSNIFLLDFDSWALGYVNGIGGKYYRYCDDMIFIVPPEYQADLPEIVQKKLRLLKLRLNIDKTKLSTFTVDTNGQLQSDKPLQYLGFIFDGKRITIRSAAFAKYSERMKKAVRLAKKTKDKHNKSRRDSGQSERKLYRKKLYSRYSHLGKRNFIRYGYRAAKIMRSQSIKRQLKPWWNRLLKEIEG